MSLGTITLLKILLMLPVRKQDFQSSGQGYKSATIRAKSNSERSHRSLSMVELRAETSGQLESTPVTEGSDVKAGDELARLRVDDRNFRVREAEASLAQATLDIRAHLSCSTKSW